ncbi:MmcQ/YjbR family DNA-binding protein [Chungangia koreensis]|uniref:MmcQ/YjbR family DNA-binding protein n=1 Tax=Chungangia koreensis TaxID=752657 RepID=A0ABV8X2V8_9LACT
MNYPWLHDYLLNKKGVNKDYKEEWNWDRYMIGDKLYAAVCKNSEGKDDLVTLKLKPEEGELLREQYEDVIPGYYMNKVHWNSVKLNGHVPDEVLREMADQSYELVLRGLTKKKQKEILEEA